MNINLDELREKLGWASCELSPAPRQGIRVRTPFLYPDGDIIDVFIVGEGNNIRVTDFGEALGWLRTQSFTGKLSPGQEQLVQNVCTSLGVELCRGQLVRKVRNGNIPSAVFFVAQAARQIADLKGR